VFSLQSSETKHKRLHQSNKIVVLVLFRIFYNSVTFVSSQHILNANFLPSQCWDPAKKSSSESSAEQGERYPRSFDNQLGGSSPMKPQIRPNFKFLDLSSFSDLDFHENQFDTWVPPPDPPNVTETIANNDIRAYFYYLSDPK
jgi:hypothetical protein